MPRRVRAPRTSAAVPEDPRKRRAPRPRRLPATEAGGTRWPTSRARDGHTARRAPPSCHREPRRSPRPGFVRRRSLSASVVPVPWH